VGVNDRIELFTPAFDVPDRLFQYLKSLQLMSQEGFAFRLHA